ncbi:MAG: hypothetical protein ACFFDT_35800 [Candidatus Hodarchaeota archaeon]
MMQNQHNHEINPNTFLSANVRQQQLRKCFQLGIPHLSDLIELYPGSLILIQGSLPRSVSQSLITQLTVSLLINNPNFDLVFIDSTTIFPYYQIANKTRKYGLNPLVILDRIQLARAFNYHQITEILSQKLPHLIEKNENIRIILIPQVSSLYVSDEALKYLEYDNLTITSSILELTRALGSLKKLILQYDLIGLMTADSAPRSQKPLGGTFLAHIATDIVRVEVLPTSNRSSRDYNLLFSVQKGGPPVQTKLSHLQTGKKQTCLTKLL